MMWPQRCRIALALILLAGVPAAASAAAGDQHPGAATHSQPAGKKAKTKAAKPAAKTSRASAKALPPGAIPDHPPPPSTTHSQFEVPQAKNLAGTPDVVLNTRVRATLFSALTPANAETITSETTNGVVTLTGTVKSNQLRARAEQAARKIHGVRAVKNRLKVQ